MNETKIEWCDKTWNPITGCTKCSPGCVNCYAFKIAYTRLAGRFGYPADDPFRPGTFHPSRLNEPTKLKKMSRIFVSSMGDLFHEDVANEHLWPIFSEMCGTQWINGHVFLLLTKRPKRMREVIELIKEDLEEQRKPIINPDGTKTIRLTFGFPLNNIWLGVTVCNQQEADEKIPILLGIPADKRFVSIEPMLGPVDVSRYISRGDYYMTKCEYCGWVGTSELCGTGDCFASDDVICPECKKSICGNDHPGLDWVISGSETGPKARPANPDWFRSIRDQCLTAKVPFFLKQINARHHDELDGQKWKQFPKRS